MITSFDKFNMLKLIELSDDESDITTYYNNSMMDKNQFIEYHNSLINKLKDSSDQLVIDYITAINKIINTIKDI